MNIILMVNKTKVYTKPAVMRGIQGPQGPRGPIGPKGPKGDQGLSIKGPKGGTGLSAYEVWLSQGYEGTEEEYLASLRGGTPELGVDYFVVAGPAGRDGVDASDVDVSKFMGVSTYDPANGARQVAFSDELPSLTPYVSNTFETVSKNLRTYNYAPTYLGSGLINYLTYTVGTGTIVKTYTYSSDLVSTIVLSGDTPSGIDLTKTFTYTGTVLTGVTYS